MTFEYPILGMRRAHRVCIRIQLGISHFTLDQNVIFMISFHFPWLLTFSKISVTSPGLEISYEIHDFSSFSMMTHKFDFSRFSMTPCTLYDTPSIKNRWKCLLFSSCLSWSLLCLRLRWNDSLHSLEQPHPSCTGVLLLILPLKTWVSSTACKWTPPRCSQFMVH